MIARLSGILAETGADHAVIDVNGVGYLAHASSRTLSAIGPIGGNVLLLTEMQVREDAITLFGFGSAAERDWFRLLTGVQGVGGRVALAILSVLEPNDLSRAIASGDKAMIARANGVGPKLAQRIVVELKDKPIGGGDVGSFHAQVHAAPAAAAPSVAGDAVVALMGLGTPEAVGRRAVERVLERLGEAAPLQAVIKGALQELGR